LKPARTDFVAGDEVEARFAAILVAMDGISSS